MVTRTHNRSDSAAPEEERDSVARAPGAGPLDAPPSNRASNTCKDDRFEVLSRHVDSLELSFPGHLSTSVENELVELKERAQSFDPVVQANAQILVGGQCFSVRDKGAPRFPFVLENDSFFIKLSGSSNTSLPFAYCQPRNAHLLRVGPEGARSELRRLLSEIGQVTGPETVSRVDLAVDFVGDRVASWDPMVWVTRLPDKASHTHRDRFSGWTIGSKKSLQLGLYDKTLEIETKSGKTYLYEIWGKEAWAPWDTVWRAELRFRRQILAQFGLKTVDDVVAAIPGLWRYALETSIRLTVPNPDDATRSRWPNDPLWDCLLAVDWGRPPVRLSRAYKGAGAPSDDYVGIHGVSLLTSVMGRDGVLEPGPAFGRLRDLMWDYLVRRELATGLRPEEALLARALAKGRRYHTLQNVTGTPALPPQEAPAAQAYRKASDGG
jgi:hypothetical protein